MLHKHSIFHHDSARPLTAFSRLGIMRETSLAKRRAILQLEADEARRRKRDQSMKRLQCAIARGLDVFARLLQSTAERLRQA